MTTFPLTFLSSSFHVDLPYPFISLFDGGQERYEKIRGSAKKSIINQFGLTLVHFDKETLTYEAHVYNFYICPRSFGPVDDCFLMQPSSVEFLASNGFDFNKVPPLDFIWKI